MTAENEKEVRALRDKVYGVPSTDKNWEGCRENWLRPGSVKWLREKAGAPDPKTDPK